MYVNSQSFVETANAQTHLIICCTPLLYFTNITQVSWEHSGRVLDLRLRGGGFEPLQRHCVVFLSKIHLSLLSTGSTQEDRS